MTNGLTIFRYLNYYDRFEERYKYLKVLKMIIINSPLNGILIVIDCCNLGKRVANLSPRRYWNSNWNVFGNLNGRGFNRLMVDTGSFCGHK